MYENGSSHQAPSLPGAKQRSVQLAIAVLLVLSAVFLFFSSQSAHPLLYIYLAALFVVTMVPFLRSAARGPIDWFEPISPVSFLYFIYFIAYTIYVVQNPYNPARLGDYSIQGLSLAVIYTAVGFAFLLLGYYSTLPGKLCKRFPPLKFSAINSRVVPIVYTLYFVGTLLRLILISKGWHIKYNAGAYFHEVPAGFYIIDYLTTLCTFSFMLATIYYFAGLRNRGFVLMLWAVMLPAEVLFAFLSGNKSAFLPIMFVILGAYHYFKRTLPIRYLAIALVVIVFVVTPVITTYRSIDGVELRSKGFLDGLFFSINRIASDLSSYSPVEYLQFSYEAFLERMNGSGAFSLVIEAVPERMDYQYGKTLMLAFTLLVPTFLWPGKYEFYQSILVWDDLIFGRRGYGGIAITQVGELYLNFHLFGIVIGMFVLGIFYKFVHLYFTKDKNPVGMFIFTNLWLSIIFIEFPLGAAYANLVKHLSILFVITWLVNRGRVFGKSDQRISPPTKWSQGMEVIRG
jgi:hypothetical protein